MNEDNENHWHLNFDDRAELMYAKRAVAFLVKERKKVAEELATERRIVNKLNKKAHAIAMADGEPDYKKGPRAPNVRKVAS